MKWKGNYYPLATPLPTPAGARTPAPDDPRASDLGGMADYAAHSVYKFSGVVDGSLRVTDIQDPLSRSFLVGAGQHNCVAELRRVLDGEAPLDAGPGAFCGRPAGSIPLHFQTGVEMLQFSGGKGIRYLIASANYLTINKLYYIFQGLSDDGRYFISFLYQGIRHPYLAEKELFEMNLGPLIAWRAGQYEEAAQSYQVFNERVETLLEAGQVPLYPALDLLDALVESIEIQ